MLKTLARQGLRAMREYANEMLSALSDPQAISSFMAQLPSEVQEIVKSIQQVGLSQIACLCFVCLYVYMYVCMHVIVISTNNFISLSQT